MRFIKSSISVCVVAIFCFVGFLAMRNFQLEGASFKTCVLLSGLFIIWLVYHINLIIDKIQSIENYKSTIKRMREKIDLYIDMEHAVSPTSLVRCIRELRESALAITHPGREDTSLTLGRLADIEHQLNNIVSTLLRGLPEGERLMWERRCWPAAIYLDKAARSAREINHLKEPNEVIDWQNLAASLERRISE